MLLKLFGPKFLKDIDMEKSKTVCFTGHRSQKLPWKFDEQNERCVKMKEQLKTEIVCAIKKGFTTFITGMALGFDTICAEMILDLKNQYPKIKLYGAIPCRCQEKPWKENDKLRYKKLLKQLDGIRCIYEEYNGAECMLERNRYMVDKSSLVITLFDGTNGGTKKTLDYAKMCGVETIIIRP